MDPNDPPAPRPPSAASAARRYSAAVAATAVGWVLREAMTPGLGPTALPFITFFPAVACAAWYGGLGPAILATALATAVAHWAFFEPVHAFGPVLPAALLAFPAAAAFIVTAIALMHRARREVARSRDTLSVTLSSIGDAVAVTDAEGRVTFLNAEAERLTGRRSADAAGRPIAEALPLLHETTRRPVENPVPRVLREGVVVGLGNHTVLVAADGSETPIEDTAAPIRRADGEPPQGVVLVFRDVREQRRAQIAQARLAAVVESSGDAIVSKSTDGTILSWNPAAERLFGWRADEIVGRSVLALIPPELRAEEEMVLSRLREGLPAELLETQRMTKDGRRLPVSVRVSPLRDAEGAVVGASTIVRDLSEVVAARDALAREKEFLATTLSSIGDAVVATDVERRVTFMNDVAERLTGWTQEEAAGRPLPEVFRIVHETTRSPVEDPALRAMREGVVVGLANHTVLLARDGGETPIDDSAAPIRGRDGGVTGAVLVFRDTGERRRADRRRSLRLAVTQVLAQGASAEEATPRVVRVVCEQLGWAAGSFWTVDGDVLRCAGTWAATPEAHAEFVDECARRTFERGAGLPGRVWSTGRAWWIPDVAQDANFPRAPVAQRAGLHAAFAVPVTHGDETLAVVEFFSPEIREPDPDLLEMMGTIGAQIGQFVVRARAEEAARRLAGLVESSQDAIVGATLDGRVTSWNSGARALYGYDAAEVLGRPLAMLCPEGEESDVAAALARIRAGEAAPSYEARRRARDGRTVEVSVTISPVRSAGGEVVGASAIERDIGERKRIERALRRSEERSRFLAEASASLSVLTDPDSTLQRIASLAVPEFADWCGVDVLLPTGELRRLAVRHADPAKVALVEELARRWPPRPGDAGGVHQVLRTGEPVWAPAIPEARLREAAQDEAHLRFLSALSLRSYICVPLRAGRRVAGAITFVTAESGRVYDEEDLRAAVDLGARASIALDNADLLAAMRLADRRKNEFLATLAHELRNPLAPIRNSVALLQLRGPQDPELAEARDVIDRQVRHLSRLLDDLLDVNRLGRQKLELRRQTVTLASVIAGALETARPGIEAGRHDVTVDVPGDVLLDADPVRLAQVFANLLNNAAKYMDPGGTIAVRGRREGREVAVSVRDTGMGIPAETLPRLFEMFSQAPRALERAQGGVGIGLALAKGLVELHGGRISAHSEGPGRGSEFVVRLPALDGGTAPAAPAPPAPPRRRPGRRVLVADDLRDGADSLAMMLRRLGHDVEVAYDGAAAYASIEARRPQVALLDLGMPGMTGYEVCRRVREQPWGASVRLVALTGWGQEEDRRRTEQAGFDRHLLKPVDAAALVAVLEELAPPAG